MKKILSFLFSIVIIMTLILYPLHVNASALSSTLIQEINYDYVTDPEAILRLAQSSGIRHYNAKGNETIEIKQLISQKKYYSGTVINEYAKSVIQMLDSRSVAYENKKDSWGKYDIACVLTVNYKHYSNEPTTPEHGSYGIVVTSTSFAFTDMGSDPIYLSKVNMYYHGFHSVSEPSIDRYATYNNPSSGTNYILNSNDDRWYAGDFPEQITTGAIVTFSNGTVSGDYDLMIELSTLLN